VTKGFRRGGEVGRKVSNVKHRAAITLHPKEIRILGRNKKEQFEQKRAQQSPARRTLLISLGGGQVKMNEKKTSLEKPTPAKANTVVDYNTTGTLAPERKARITTGQSCRRVTRQGKRKLRKNPAGCEDHKKAKKHTVPCRQRRQGRAQKTEPKKKKKKAAQSVGGVGRQKRRVHD